MRGFFYCTVELTSVLLRIQNRQGFVRNTFSET